MADKKDKTISYRRAIWIAEHAITITLSERIRDALGRLPDVGQRTVQRDNGQELKLLSVRKDREGGGVSLHITADTPGESASVVPKTRHKDNEIEVATASPPSDAEYMDGDAFVYVKGNDVCICTTGMHDGTIRNFLQVIFRKAGLKIDASQFDLAKVANVNKIKLLQAQGVKEIELKSVLYEATLEYHKRKDHTLGILGVVGKQIKAVLGNEHDVNHDALKVQITLKTDQRRNGIVVGEKRIKELAKNLIDHQEEDDEFVIITKQGQRIGPKEILMRSNVRIDRVGKSVQRDKAWKELKSFYDDLEGAGALEQ